MSTKSFISADRTNKGTLPLTILRCIFKSNQIIASSMTSNLEAFGYNPAHGSFAALSSQITSNTNDVNEGFLLY
ncbi:hypothetical protein K450DRAFT_254911 [Umbelopsis ramanniana AG]|uniref:Uncharacterized protein n=1 Tax=Umbelopsis ramanniana AG TaxID=1314678 RepID=A0AAD5E5K1_UMBRA|nr:uncharacterized protein K450DRAFT_254911 [Umbelopsis ramanniana AG]KAI8576785.1 hypothetical protein K450DRAFT_254911 [Umbelopsis ramanniana AG]